MYSFQDLYQPIIFVNSLTEEFRSVLEFVKLLKSEQIVFITVKINIYDAHCGKLVGTLLVKLFSVNTL